MSIENVKELGATLLEAVELVRDTREKYAEVEEFKKHKDAIVKSVEAKKAELKDLYEAFSKARSEFSMWERTAEESKEKRKAAIKAEIEEARKQVEAEFEAERAELRQVKEAIKEHIDALRHEEDSLTEKRDALRKDLDALKAKFGG